MSCFFCDSFFHISQNCNYGLKYRKKIAAYKNCCNLCLSPFTHKHDAEWSNLCENRQKCFICFTQNHHTVFCPNFGNAPNFFVPNIDERLFPRFLAKFDFVEQCFLAFTCSKLFKIAKIEPFQIKQYPTFDDLKNVPDSNYVFSQKIVLLKNIRPQSGAWPPEWYSICSILKSKITIVKIKILKITNSKIPTDKFFQLLSFGTAEISFSHFILTPTIKFKDLIKLISNIEVVELDKTNIQISPTWINELFEYKNGNNFRQLKIGIENIDFDSQILAEFMRKKSITNVRIYLKTTQYVYIPLYHNFFNSFKEVPRYPYSRRHKNIPLLKIVSNRTRMSHKCYTL